MFSFSDLFILSILIFTIIAIWWYFTIPSNLPPGPLGLPFFGSMFDTWKGSTLPKKLCQWSDRYGPLFKLYVGNRLVLVLGDWSTIQDALVKQPDAYAGRPIFYTIFPEDNAHTGLTTSEGELWKIHRRFALSTLRDFGVGRPILEEKIKDEAEYLLEKLSSYESVSFDLSPLLANAVSNVICALVFGKRFNYDDENFHLVLKQLQSRTSETDISFLSPFVLSKRVAALLNYLPQAQRLNDINTQLMTFIRQQTFEALSNFNPERGDEPNSYIQSFYKAQHQEKKDDSTFTDRQLIASVVNLFAAGTDTTASIIRWAIFYMCHHPELQEQVFEEIRKEIGNRPFLNYADRKQLPLTEAVIMETLRLANLVPLSVIHRTTVPTKLRGYDIPEDTIVVPLLQAVLRDPKTYPNPDVFDPSRFLNKNKNGERAEILTHLIPFSAGKRMCMAESMAKMEFFLFFTTLLTNFKFAFSPDEPVPQMNEERVSIIRTPVLFKVKAIRRTE